MCTESFCLTYFASRNPNQSFSNKIEVKFNLTSRSSFVHIGYSNYWIIKFLGSLFHKSRLCVYCSTLNLMPIWLLRSPFKNYFFISFFHFFSSFSFCEIEHNLERWNTMIFFANLKPIAICIIFTYIYLRPTQTL